MSLKRKIQIAKALEKFYPPKHFEKVLNSPEETEETIKVEDVETVDYSVLKVSQLKDMAKEKSIPKYYKMKKDELIEALDGVE